MFNKASFIHPSFSDIHWILDRVVRFVKTHITIRDHLVGTGMQRGCVKMNHFDAAPFRYVRIGKTATHAPVIPNLMRDPGVLLLAWHIPSLESKP